MPTELIEREILKTCYQRGELVEIANMDILITILTYSKYY